MLHKVFYISRVGLREERGHSAVPGNSLCCGDFPRNFPVWPPFPFSPQVPRELGQRGSRTGLLVSPGHTVGFSERDS